MVIEDVNHLRWGGWEAMFHDTATLIIQHTRLDFHFSKYCYGSGILPEWEIFDNVWCIQGRNQRLPVTSPSQSENLLESTYFHMHDPKLLYTLACDWILMRNPSPTILESDGLST